MTCGAPLRLDLAAALKGQHHPERSRAARLLSEVMRDPAAPPRSRAVAANNYAELLRDYRGQSPLADLDRAAAACRYGVRLLRGGTNHDLAIRRHLLLTHASLLLRGTNLANDWWVAARHGLSSRPEKPRRPTVWDDRLKLIAKAGCLLTEVESLTYQVRDLAYLPLVDENWGDLYVFRAWVSRKVDDLRRGRRHYSTAYQDRSVDTAARLRLLSKLGATFAYEATDFELDPEARRRLLRRAARCLHRATRHSDPNSKKAAPSLDRAELMAVWANRGEVELALGNHRHAATCFRRALGLARRRCGETGPSWALRLGSVLDGYLVASVRSEGGEPVGDLVRLERNWGRGAARSRRR